MGRHSEGKSPIIQQVTPRHCSMARALVAGGLTPSDLARLYGMTKSQVSIVINSPAFLTERARIEGGADKNAMELGEEIIALRDMALRNVSEDLRMTVVDDKDRALRQKATLAALEMSKLRGSGGITIKGDVIQNQQNNNKFTLKQLQDNVFNLLDDEEE